MRAAGGAGLSAGQITRRTRRPKAEVEAALTVTGSELAPRAVGRFEFLTLDQAATIAEFDEDTEAAKVLTVAAREGPFEHVASRLRDDREREQVRARLAEDLTGSGVTVIEQPATTTPPSARYTGSPTPMGTPRSRWTCTRAAPGTRHRG